METTIPFSGFYHSFHDYNLDQALEMVVSDDQGSAYDGLLDLARSSVDWSVAHDHYAKQFTRYFADKFDLDIKFKLLSSPKYYNFETDRIFCEISESEVLRLFNAVDRAVLERRIKERFTSCDGFISHYPNSLERWDSDVTTWDHNQVGTLIEAYIEAHDAYDSDYECYISQDIEAYNSVCEAIKDDRVFRIADYLRERQNRSISR